MHRSFVGSPQRATPLAQDDESIDAFAGRPRERALARGVEQERFGGMAKAMPFQTKLGIWQALVVSLLGMTGLEANA
jgi:hypothetical protein